MLLDLDEEAEGDSAAERFLRDGEKGESACGWGIGVFGGGAGDVMDVIGAVGVGEFLGRGVVDFGEDEGGEGGRVGAGRDGVLGENGGIVGYAGAARGRLVTKLEVI